MFNNLNVAESMFIRDMIDKYHSNASEAGIRIVPACGFDSIPSDLGTLLLANHFARKGGLKLSSVRYSLYDYEVCLR